MMKMLRYLLFILLISAGLISCEKNIDVDFPPGERPYVVEGYIENGVVPIITISRGISFLSNISVSDFQGLFVNNANVSISVDGGTAIPLQMIEIQGIVIYTTPSIIGEVGKKYDLVIEVDGKTFTSSTTILTPHPLDSIGVEAAPGERGTKDSLVQLIGYLNEPEPKGNYYRLLTRRNEDPVFDVSFNSIHNDQLINGKQYKFNIYRGKSEFQNNDTADFSQFGYFKRGDTVYVKWASIDKPQYDFWNTFESQGNSFGNPFSPTVVLKSNIKGNGGVGIWAGYGAFLDTLIVP